MLKVGYGTACGHVGLHGQVEARAAVPVGMARMVFLEELTLGHPLPLQATGIVGQKGIELLPALGKYLFLALTKKQLV